MTDNRVTRVYSYRPEKGWPFLGSLALVKRPLKTVEGDLVHVWQSVMIVHKQTDYRVMSGKYFLRILAVPVTLKRAVQWCGCANASWFRRDELTPYEDVFPDRRKLNHHQKFYQRWMRKHGVQGPGGYWRYEPKKYEHHQLSASNIDHLDGDIVSDVNHL